MSSVKENDMFKSLMIGVCLSCSMAVYAAPTLWFGDSAGRLATIDIANGNVNVIGNMGVAMTDIAFDPNGQLWGIDFMSLYKIDKSTANRTSVGVLGTSANSLVFDTSGTLYAANTSLYKVNTATGIASLVGNGGHPYASSGDLAFVDGNIFLSSGGGDKLVKINTGNGAGTLIGNIGFSSVFGLASPNGTDLYGMSGTQVLSINPATGAGTSIHNYNGQGLSAAYGTAFFPEAGAEEKKGMTWGFAGASDIWPNGVTQSCNHRKARFACETYPVNSPQSNYCGISYSPGVETSTVDNSTRQCDPVNGDTACSTKKYVLCIAEVGNPYFKRQPPYSGGAGYPNNINLIPFDRTRYKTHAAESSEGWVDQFVKLSRNKISGEDLATNGGVVAGNAECGAGWRMASFNDGKWVQGMGLSTAYGNLWPPASKQSGGWAFHANMAPNANQGSLAHHGDSGGIPTSKFVKERYWVNSTQGGNCWN